MKRTKIYTAFRRLLICGLLGLGCLIVNGVSGGAVASAESLAAFPTMLSLAPGETGTITVTGGSGTYWANWDQPAASGQWYLNFFGYTAPYVEGEDVIFISDEWGNVLEVPVLIQTSATPVTSGDLSVSETQIEVAVGQEYAIYIEGGTPPYYFAPDDFAVVQITPFDLDAPGYLTVTGISGGTTTISIYDSAFSNFVTVTVNVVGQDITPLTLSATTLDLGLNDEKFVQIAGGLPPYYTYSSNAAVAVSRIEDADQDGADDLIVSGHASGDCTITVFDSAFKTIELTVAVGLPLAVYPTLLDLSVGDFQSLTITGGVPPYQYQSQDESLISAAASEYENILTITGLQSGQTNVKFRDSAGAEVAVPITVSQTTSPLQVTPASLELAEGSTKFIEISGGVKAYTVSSTNSAVAATSIDENTVTVTGKGGGSATITVTDSTDSTLTVPVSVKASVPPISLSATQVTLTAGDAEQVNISGGTGFYQSESSDINVATESISSGNAVIITGIAEGNATVTITDSEAHQAVISVTVASQTTAASTPQPTAPIGAASGLGKAIIIAGGGAQQENTLFEYSNDLCQRMYRLLKERGFSDTDVLYMNPWPPDIDLDGHPNNDLQDYQLFEPDKDLEEAFTVSGNSLNQGSQFILYVHGHARQDHLKITKSFELSAAELNTLLAKIPAGIQQIIILDTCYSGSFLDELKGVADRIVLTSSDDHTLSWNVEYSNFSDTFIRSLRRGKTLKDAFQAAEDLIIGDPKLFGDQRPWLDDDQDGTYSSKDGARAARLYLGKEGVHAAAPPAIVTMHPRIELEAENATTTLWVKTSPSNDGIKTVRAVLIKPGFTPGQYLGEETGFAREEVELGYNPVQDRYETVYDRFRDAGVWRIMYQAQGTDGAWSDPSFSEVNAGGVSSLVTSKVGFNQSVYKAGEQLKLDYLVNGEAVIDIYMALFFPDGNFQTLIYPDRMSFTNTIEPYQTQIEITGERTYSIVDMTIPNEFPEGTYTCFGVVTHAGAGLAGYIHFNFKEFSVTR